MAPDQEGGAPASPQGPVPSTPTTLPGGLASGGPQRETGDQELLAVPNLGGGGGGLDRGDSRASTLSRIGIGLLVVAVIGLLGLIGAAIVRERRWRQALGRGPVAG